MHDRETEEYENDTGDDGEYDGDAAVSSVPGKMSDAALDHGDVPGSKSMRSKKPTTRRSYSCGSASIPPM
jgi:hypothetical protein